MSNRLAQAASTYLRQHADNPVDWFPWGPEAFAKAQAEDKPIFLSIGYATCHWCHVMARESFSDPSIAELLNRHFVSIKVDRQELPQVDEMYMQAALALGCQGGWPLSVFCTPKGAPFFAGTYFPPQSWGGLPSFRQVLQQVVAFWNSQRHLLKQEEAELRRLLLPPAPAPGPLNLEELEKQALARLEEEFDPQWGGFGGAPKFPMVSRLEFLSALAQRGSERAWLMLRTTLDGMAQGGLRDPLFGGFHRYSTDAQWFVPHFEKLVPDNALLARLYLEAGQIFAKPSWRQVGAEALAFLQRLQRQRKVSWGSAPLTETDVTHYALAAGWDADTHGVEGATYLFTWAELEQLLTQEERQLLLRLSPFPWGTQPRPLALRPADVELAQGVGLSPSALAQALSTLLRRLRHVARSRGLPAVDELPVSGWTAMAVTAFLARMAGNHGPWRLADAWGEEEEPLGPPAVMRAYQRLRDHGLYPFLWLESLWQLGWRRQQQIPRVLARGANPAPETLEDLAWTAEALLQAFLVTGAVRLLQRAHRLLLERVPHYRGPLGELYTTPDDAAVASARQRHPFDGAHPNPAAVLCHTLYRCAWLTGNQTLRQWADQALTCEARLLARSPHNATSWLAAAHLARHLRMLVVAGSPLWPSTRALLRAAYRHRPRPHLVVFLNHWPPTTEELAFLPVFQEREAAGKAAAVAYFCTGTRCWPPVTTPRELARTLSFDMA
ncbi:MAG: thioredoxin domain-containing protein [Thermoanaerobaculum sp.]|nr:thioredoxin domain-containing protein [Thermoanaerobaculum sp.]MDW7967840.1 thioredoxin domain-containing protein [Thermoanaerobaculum sp.]